MLESRPATQIIFDLDGTLVQTRVASWDVFRQVNIEFALGVDTEEKYFALLQGNLFERIRHLCDTTEKADAVTASFLAKLGSDYHPDMVPGMVDVVHALAPQSTLAVLSSNHTSVIRRVLTGNGIEYCFAHVFGGDVEPDKTVGIRRFIADAARGTGRRCSPFYDEGAENVPLAEDQTVIVTDTVGDVEAAIAAGIRAIGVSWGMHAPAQLTAAGAEFVAYWPQELVSYLRPADTGTASGASDSCEVKSIPLVATDLLAHAAVIRTGRRGSFRSETLLPDAASTPSSLESEKACGCPVAQSVKRVSSTSSAGATALPPAAPSVSDELLDAMRRILQSS